MAIWGEGIVYVASRLGTTEVEHVNAEVDDSTCISGFRTDVTDMDVFVKPVIFSCKVQREWSYLSLLSFRYYNHH